MLTAVKFNDQLHLTAAEIDDIGPDRHLARKLDPEEAAIAQARPQSSLGLCLSPPQPPREVSR
jgi:hypothetical protein